MRGRGRLLCIPAVLALIAAFAPASVSGQSGKTWTVPRTPDGQPDLRGMWVNFDSTPFETAGTAPTAPVAVPQGTGVNPPSHWADHDSPMKAPRPAMVVDPPDGKDRAMDRAMNVGGRHRRRPGLPSVRITNGR